MTIRQAKTIKVCQGPGCKAWGSETLLRHLRLQFKWDPQSGCKRVYASPCMNRCGGGTSVELEDSRNLLKVRDISQAIESALCTLPATP